MALPAMPSPRPSPPPSPAPGLAAIPIMPTPGIGGSGEANAMGFLRDISVVAKDIQRSFLDIRSRAKASNEVQREDAVAQALQGNSRTLEANRSKIQDYLERIGQILRANPSVHYLWGDEVTHVEESWERAKADWPEQTHAGRKHRLDEILQRVDVADGLLKEIIYHCGLVTIPPRANEHLDAVRVGRYLDYNAMFKDEVPDDDNRREILRYMEAHPSSVHGMVDVDNGLIWKYDPEPRKRRRSYWLIGGTIGLGVAIVVLFSNVGRWLNLTDWPVSPTRTSELLAAYMFILLGGLAHILVDALKAQRVKGFRSPALEDLALWIHIKQESILSGLLSLWVGFLGLAFTLPTIGWQLAFFVGYGIDSFVDIFLQRFGVKASAEIEGIKKALGEQ